MNKMEGYWQAKKKTKKIFSWVGKAVEIITGTGSVNVTLESRNKLYYIC